MEYITSVKLNQDMLLKDYSRLNSQILRSGILINIYTKKICEIKCVVLEIPPPQYSLPPSIPEIDINQQIKESHEKFFEDLRDTIKEMSSLGINIKAIIFHAGGTLAIPECFRKFCKDKKIKILVYNQDNKNDFINELGHGELSTKHPELEGIF